ncbi:MAG: hypothetical protein ABI068_11540 [Ktedonobacterales bacterium]
MDKGGHIRLSTMEIVLLVVLTASLILGLLQARQDVTRERQLRDAMDATGEQ